jgi:beta-glucosidase
MSSPEVKAGQSLLVEADITNTGKVKGDEVAELYLSYPGRPNAPIRALKGFKRISLDVGGTAHVHFELNPRDLSLVRDDGAREILSGTYNLYVGGSQPAADGSGLQGHFRIIGTRLLPK